MTSSFQQCCLPCSLLQVTPLEPESWMRWASVLVEVDKPRLAPPHVGMHSNDVRVGIESPLCIVTRQGPALPIGLSCPFTHLSARAIVTCAQAPKLSEQARSCVGPHSSARLAPLSRPAKQQGLHSLSLSFFDRGKALDTCLPLVQCAWEAAGAPPFFPPTTPLWRRCGSPFERSIVEAAIMV